MRVLLLGGTGFVGRVISQRLNKARGIVTLVGARHALPGQSSAFVCVDATDADSLLKVLTGVDVVVNCVVGPGHTIRRSAAAIVAAARMADKHVKLIHMSSMAVYGSREGILMDDDPVSDDGNWYGSAKISAERILREYGDGSGSSTVLRIGCVYGPGSALWVDRIGLLLRRGRLGDLAEMGDGWSNLVHVEDIAQAVELIICADDNGARTYNMSAPDSPRWNSYFRDFSLGIGRVPLKYKTQLAMTVESKLIAPPVKALERLSAKGWLRPLAVQSIPPSLLRLWRQQIKLDSARIEGELGLTWTPYAEGLKDSVEYFMSKYGQ